MKKIKSITPVSEITIGEFADIMEQKGEIVKKENGKEIIHLPFEILTPSVNENKKLEYKKIDYVMKHKTKKTLYKITIDNDEIVVTEDHSCIVLRDDKLISVKPKEIKATDIFIKLENNGLTYHNKFSIENLGETEDYVYDLEVQNNHNFFGNNILVHNSDYLKFDKVVYKIFEKKFNNKKFEELNDDEIKQLTDMILKFIETKIQPIINEAVDEVQDILNAYHKGFVGAKVEKIMNRGIWVAKKKYAVSKLWEEGAYYTSPSLSVTGLELVRSSTPEFAKKVFEKALMIMLLKNEKDLQNYLKNVKKEFNKLIKTPKGIKQVARISGVNGLDYNPKSWYKNVYDNKGNLIKKLPTPINSRAAILHNIYVKEHNLEDRFELIEEGNKINYIYLKTPNTMGNENVIAFIDEDFLKEANIIDYIDGDLQYEKVIEQPLKIISNTLNWELQKTSSLGGLF